MNELQKSISRRDFLKAGMIAGCCCLFPPVLSAKEIKAENASASVENYYVSHSEELMAVFKGTSDGARQYLTGKYGDNFADKVTKEAGQKFASLLPGLPNVGGSKNIDIEYVPIAAWYLAFYLPMRDCGKTAEDTGRMIYDLNEYEMSRMHKDKALAEGAYKFTPEYLNKMKQWAEWTQKKEYPANWVAELLIGDGKEYDFGYNYTECALVKFFRANNVPEIAPYVCLNDFLRSKTLGTGLQRSKTLAQGDEVCNFRYKKGREVMQGWGTEVLKFGENK